MFAEKFLARRMKHIFQLSESHGKSHWREMLALRSSFVSVCNNISINYIYFLSHQHAAVKKQDSKKDRLFYHAPT